MRTRLARAPRSALLILLCLATVFPLLTMLSSALQPEGSVPVGISWPSEPHWENFVLAWKAAQFWPLLVSSVLIVLGVVPLSLALATFAGYGLAMLKPPGHKVIGAVFVIGLTLPGEALITPLYYQSRDWGLLGTRWALILPLIGLNMAFGVYWMRSHFRGIPADLHEAASIDGAGPWSAFRRVHLPLSVNAISALSILFFLWTWNQFLLALVLVDDPTQRTMAGGIAAFQGEYSTDVVLLNAGALELMVPSLIVFIVFQRRFVSALMQGSIR
jgi:raffinose/stachyose/melibiose transport system permease protein